jgi:hypothetical protein
MKHSKADIAQAWAFLEPYRNRPLKAEYIHCDHRSGSSRIRFLSTDKDGNFSNLSWAIARITESRFNRDYGCIVAPFMNMRQDFAIISNFNYSAASHDLAAKSLDLSWNTPEGKKALGLKEDDNVYDTYFFNASRL